MAATKQHSLTINRAFAAKREDVFRAWTDPAILSTWWGPPGFATDVTEMDVREGGTFRFVMKGEEGDVHRIRGEYREIRPRDRLIFTFFWEEGDHADIEMLVTLQFAEKEGGTEMTLLHEGLPEAEARDSYGSGWEGSFDRLAALTEN